MISDKKLIECLEYCGNKAEIPMCNLCIFRTNSKCRSLLLSTAAKRIKELNDSLVEAENENRRLKWGSKSRSDYWG